MWATQVPIIAPLTAKTANVAARGVIRARYSAAACVGARVISTTFQASFTRRIARITQPVGSISQLLQAVERAARERVVVVVPGLAHRERGEPEDVGRVVVDGEAPGAEEVADGVDRPRHVVGEEDPHRPAPQRGLERAPPGAGQREPDRGRDHDPERHPDARTSCG